MWVTFLSTILRREKDINLLTKQRTRLQKRDDLEVAQSPKNIIGTKSDSIHKSNLD